MVKQYSGWHEFQLTLENLQCRQSCLSQSSEAPFIVRGDIFNLASKVRSTVPEANVWSQTNFILKCLLLFIFYKEFYMEDHLSPWWLHCRRLHFLEEGCCVFFPHSHTFVLNHSHMNSKLFWLWPWRMPFRKSLGHCDEKSWSIQPWGINKEK